MVSQNATSNRDIGFTHEDFAALLDEYDYHFNPGDIVPGVVFSVEPRGALIDIGAKTAAYIPIQEMSINRVEEPDEVLQPEETREFFILTDENEDGQLTLSIRRIEYMRAWERVRQLQAEDATVRSGVFATNRGGALVRIEGLRGFIPGSHISTRQPKEDLVAQDLPLKFLEVDEERNRLVLSHRRALVERKMSGLKVGEVVIGSVRGIKPYGAFIDIGGVSGLLHISEISHDHIDTPSSVFDINDELKVMIIDLDAERGRISLSTKQLEPIAGAMLNNRELVFEQADKMAQRFRRKLQYQTQGLASEDIEAKLNEEFGPIGQRPGETKEAEITETEAIAENTVETATETEAVATEEEASVTEEATSAGETVEDATEETSENNIESSSDETEEEEIVSAANE
ncbi:MAG: S1 RNA-binding domain-containing protein [Cyanobacteria bacterium]|jgi:small subunit ribosomal protein S1|nr:S1 RNA-binding domain-containing protein [Cyanobacteria bacterium GSL.Bin1]